MDLLALIPFVAYHYYEWRATWETSTVWVAGWLEDLAR